MLFPILPSIRYTHPKKMHNAAKEIFNPKKTWCNYLFLSTIDKVLSVTIIVTYIRKTKVLLQAISIIFGLPLILTISIFSYLIYSLRAMYE